MWRYRRKFLRWGHWNLLLHRREKKTKNLGFRKAFNKKCFYYTCLWLSDLHSTEKSPGIWNLALWFIDFVHSFDNVLLEPAILPHLLPLAVYLLRTGREGLFLVTSDKELPTALLLFEFFYSRPPSCLFVGGWRQPRVHIPLSLFYLTLGFAGLGPGTSGLSIIRF